MRFIFSNDQYKQIKIFLCIYIMAFEKNIMKLFSYFNVYVNIILIIKIVFIVIVFCCC